jgi:hypothetical protein
MGEGYTMMTINESDVDNPDTFADSFQDNGDDTRFRCRHIFTEGRRCGSPCLRGEHFCYYHHTARVPVYSARQRCARKYTPLGTSGLLDLPMPEDRDAIRLAAGQILHAIADNQVDTRRAGMMLYALQIANCALPRQTANSMVQSDSKEDLVDFVTLDSEGAILAPQTQFIEPAAPEERQSYASRLLQSLEQNQEIALARNRINELEARLSNYETVVPTKLDLNGSEEMDASHLTAPPADGIPTASKTHTNPQYPDSEKRIKPLDVAGQRSPNRRKRRANLRAQRLHRRHRAESHQSRHQRILDQVLTSFIPNQALNKALRRSAFLPRLRYISCYRHIRRRSAPTSGSLIIAVARRYSPSHKSALSSRICLYGTG